MDGSAHEQLVGIADATAKKRQQLYSETLAFIWIVIVGQFGQHIFKKRKIGIAEHARGA